MKAIIILAAAATALAATAAFADRCGAGPQAEGMRARLNTLHDQMDRAEWTQDRAQQRELMDLHMKHMREGMRELRKRDMPADCRMELMAEMMETMIRHQQLQPQQPSK
jgi:hypothetical protein